MLLPHLPPTLAVIAITAHMHSTSCALFGDSDVRNTILLPAPVHEREEVSFGLPAPTTSTTVALAVGDALALATARRLHVMPGRGPAEVFKSFHPGGAIGAAFASSSNSLVTPSSSSASSATASPSSAPLNGIPGQLDCIAPPLQLTHQKLISSIAIPFASIPVLSKIEPISSNVRVSDVLAAAVRHPDAKFWVLINPDLIVTPTRLRLLADIRDCGKRLYDLDEESYSIARMGWVRVPDFSSIASVRQILNGLDSALKSQRDATSIKTFTKGRVIAIVSKKIEDRILGFVEEKEIWRDDV